ncbi:hypothetical protein PUN28_005427 [Cardiocondyla obscurior]|uniref:Uncharacterized protein n=1 Tax=Cardiocondyla obscurior TaxID=286306 RepID=A0AAW2GFY4_9HYME
MRRMIITVSCDVRAIVTQRHLRRRLTEECETGSAHDILKNRASTWPREGTHRSAGRLQAASWPAARTRSPRLRDHVIATENVALRFTYSGDAQGLMRVAAAVHAEAPRGPAEEGDFSGTHPASAPPLVVGSRIWRFPRRVAPLSCTALTVSSRHSNRHPHRDSSHARGKKRIEAKGARTRRFSAVPAIARGLPWTFSRHSAREAPSVAVSPRGTKSSAKTHRRPRRRTAEGRRLRPPMQDATTNRHLRTHARIHTHARARDPHPFESRRRRRRRRMKLLISYDRHKFVKLERNNDKICKINVCHVFFVRFLPLFPSMSC